MFTKLFYCVRAHIQSGDSLEAHLIHHYLSEFLHHSDLYKVDSQSHSHNPHNFLAL